MAYQSFDSESGDSKSQEKLERIKLPLDLSGKAVLDVGCNEGFFCKAALDRGAARVVGIDNNPKVIESAKQRVPGAEFFVSSWWDIPADKFDVIIFLSAIHYEPEQRRLLSLLSTRLNKGGLLILECGAFWELEAKEWRVVQRHDGMLKFPTVRLLTEDLLDKYSVRDMGPSVNQSGDPVPRYVFHCTPNLPVIFAVGGASGSGKTSFARHLRRRGMRVIHTDPLLGRLKRNDAQLRDPFVAYVSENLQDHGIDTFVEQMIRDNKIDAFSSMTLRYVSKDDEVTIIEGFAFTFPEVRNAFERLAKAAGFRFVSTVL